jgi:hypothetical protein
MTKYFIGLTGSLAGAALGVWLVISQFILAYQPRGAAWVSDAWGDLFSGIVVLFISLAGLALYGLGLLDEITRLQQPRMTVPIHDDGRTYATVPASPEGLAVEQRSTQP